MPNNHLAKGIEQGRNNDNIRQGNLCPDQKGIGILGQMCFQLRQTLGQIGLGFFVTKFVATKITCKGVTNRQVMRIERHYKGANITNQTKSREIKSEMISNNKQPSHKTMPTMHLRGLQKGHVSGHRIKPYTRW